MTSLLQGLHISPPSYRPCRWGLHTLSGEGSGQYTANTSLSHTQPHAYLDNVGRTTSLLRRRMGGRGHNNIPLQLMSGCHGNRLICPSFTTPQQPLVYRQVLGRHLIVRQHPPAATVLEERGGEGRGGEGRGREWTSWTSRHMYVRMQEYVQHDVHPGSTAPTPCASRNCPTRILVLKLKLSTVRS